MSYQDAMRVAKVYGKNAEDRENTDPQEAVVMYKKALGYCGDAIGKCTNKEDERLIEDQIDTYRTRIKQLTTPPKKESYSPRGPSGGGGSGGTYRQRNDDDTRPKDTFELTQPRTTFADVAGMDGLKKDMERAIIWPLMYPKRYEELVGKSAKGILLYGPPGCGKTYIAESVAGEATKRAGKKVSYLYVRSSDILNSWVGNSEKNMKVAFETVAKNEPSIFFFDELEGMGGARRGHSVYADRLVSEFLADFRMIADKNVLVIGATNTPWEVDSALIRSGRIGRKILIGPPDYQSRVAIYKIHTKGRKLAPNVDFDELGKLTQDYTSSDIAQVCKVAGEVTLDEAITNPDRCIEQKDFVLAISKNRSSLYQWCAEAKRGLRNSGMMDEYQDLLNMIDETESRRAK
ncbi:MAG: AAA family ATPase [Candidatus Aenigmatarchaeota archaeon]